MAHEDQTPRDMTMTHEVDRLSAAPTRTPSEAKELDQLDGPALPKPALLDAKQVSMGDDTQLAEGSLSVTGLCGAAPAKLKVLPTAVDKDAVLAKDWSPRQLVVGTLNCLGDSFNPFEFHNAHADFRSCCGKLIAAGDALTWNGFVNGCGRDLFAECLSGVTAELRAHCSAGNSLWSFFDEAALKNDNKLLAPRLNLITFATRPHGPTGQLPYELVDTWQSEMRALLYAEGGSAAYAKDPNLLVWDCVCNVVASLEAGAYNSVCAASPLNPSNFERQAGIFFDAALRAAGGRPLVLGLQEWPQGDTPKARAFQAALDSRGLMSFCAPGEAGVAVVSSTELGPPQLVASSSPSTKEVMQSCIDDVLSEGESLDAKAIDGALATTARKVLMVSFPKAQSAPVAATVFAVVHAKEPKTEAAAKVLARFTSALGKSHPSFVAMMDSNAPKPAIATTLEEMFARDGLDRLPLPSVNTTAKERSRLHGQTYDVKKCLKRVAAPKDQLVARTGTLSEAAVFPQLTEPNVTLPSPAWGSDHALTTAVFCPEHPTRPAEHF